MSEHTKTPWRFVELVNEDGSSLTPNEAADYCANTAKHGTTGFYAIQAMKEDGKLYDVCHTGNGPDSPWNAAAIARCVNNHERLVEALQDCMECLDMKRGSEPYDSARALLAELDAGK